MSKERSPFSPGQPVPPEFFVGRDEQVKLLKRAMMQAASGKPQYVFITGERGIGKSSLAALAREIGQKEFGLVGAHALLGGADSLGEVCRRLYQALLTQLPDKNLIEKAMGVFGRYVDKIDLFGLGVEFKKDDRSRQSLSENFLPLLVEINKAFEAEGRKGIVLVADDLNGIAQDANFAQFIKSTVDQIAVGPNKNLPWVLILVGVPERMDDLKTQQPSIDRIFQVVELKLMEQTAAREFFRKTFESVAHKCDEAALDILAGVAGGFPVLWHELGDAVFWQDEDMRITEDDVMVGIWEAAKNVGRKYLKKPLYDELKSPAYKLILEYLGSGMPQGVPVKRQDALAKLPKEAARNFDNFVRRMLELDVLRQGKNRGEYEYTSLLYAFYVHLQSKASRD